MTTTLPHSNNTTSRNAAIIAAGKTRGARILIVQAVADARAAGLTDEEIAAKCPDVHKNAVRIRRGECHARKLITDSAGEKRTTDAGGKATVWHVTALGLKALGRHPGDWCVPNSEAKP